MLVLWETKTFVIPCVSEY